MLGGLSLIYSGPVAFEVSFEDTHTTALCSGRTCRDFLVSCSGSNVIDLKPISGFVTFGDDWEDRRVDKELC